jgi:copper chaperone
MYQFNVPDMTCGHCASAITKAVKAEDPNAEVEISLAEWQGLIRAAAGRARRAFGGFSEAVRDTQR